MSDDQPRQVLPRAESHQSLSNNLASSRPAPPRSRRGAAGQQRSASSRSIQRDDTASQDEPTVDEPLSQRSSSTDANSPTQDEQGDGHVDPRNTLGLGLEAHGTALEAPSMNRSVSNGSARSVRSATHSPVIVAQEIPKEEIEKALEGLTRDDLVVALGRAKVQMDQLDARLEAQVVEYETLQASSESLLSQLQLAEADNHSLHALIKQREERIDEIMAEQDKMESQVYSKMQVIESLRKQLNEVEKGRNDAEKRYGDQTSTMDKERQYYADMEALLKSQKATQAAAYEKLLSSHHELLKENERMTNTIAQIKATNSGLAQSVAQVEARLDQEALDQDSGADGEAGDNPDTEGAEGAAPSGRTIAGRSFSGRRNVSRSFAEEQDEETLRQELATIQKSHTSLTDAMATLQAEMKDLKAENATLRDQNETFIDILQEKTFSGALLSESAMLSGELARGGGKRRRSLLPAYQLEDVADDEEEEDDDDEDDEFGTSAETSGNTTIDEEEEDDVPDTPKAPVHRSSNRKASGRHARRRRLSASIVEPPPSDLASELEQIEGSGLDTEEEKRRRQERRNEKTGAVSDNIEELQKEVRDLREANQALSLYISKILDRIIAKEGYENILAADVRGTARGLGKRKPSRQALVSATFQSPSEASAASTQERNVSSSSTTSSSSGLFGFGGGANASGSAPPSSSKTAPPKSKRTSSIDWRNLPFLGGGGSKETQSPSNLRPLTLQSTSPLVGGSARKVRTSEEMEDEADVAERERIREELLKRGIQPPSNQLVQSPHSPRKTRPGHASTPSSSGGGGLAAFISRVVGGNNPAVTSEAETPAKTKPAPSATPTLSDPEKRREERQRAMALSGSGLTEPRNPGGGVAARARARLEAQSRTASSESASTTDVDNSIAGDESYVLPPPPGVNSNEGPEGASPLLGYGNNQLAAEDEDGKTAPAPWKKALRRISILGGTQGGQLASPTTTDGGATTQSPVSVQSSLSRDDKE